MCHHFFRECVTNGSIFLRSISTDNITDICMKPPGKVKIWPLCSMMSITHLVTTDVGASYARGGCWNYLPSTHPATCLLPVQCLGHHAWVVNLLIINRSTSAFYCSAHHLKVCINFQCHIQHTRYHIQEYHSFCIWYRFLLPRHYLANLCPDLGVKGISPDYGILHLSYNYVEQGSQ